MIIKSLDWKKYYERGVFIYLCIFSWFGFFIALPYVWHLNKLLALGVMIFPGLFISVGLIYFQHECWHGYFKTRMNRRLFVFICTIVFVQPHQYDAGHRTHHARVNTYDDLEFYPIGKIHNRVLRSLCNCMSICFGSIFLLLLGTQPAGYSMREKIWRAVATWSGAAILWGSVGYAAYALWQVSLTEILFSYALMIWMVSVAHHHNELIEHGNLIVEGDFRFRASQTRNLLPNGWLARFFLFLVHQDSREHTLHHTEPSTFSRPFVGQHPMPAHAVYISLRDYAGIVVDMMLARENIISATASKPAVAANLAQAEARH